jgi:hypothetical protein
MVAWQPVAFRNPVQVRLFDRALPSFVLPRFYSHFAALSYLVGAESDSRRCPFSCCNLLREPAAALAVCESPL